MTHERIETDPAIMQGKPVIVGMRVTVEQIVRECARRLEGHTLNVGWRQPADTDQFRRRQFPDALAVTASFRTTHFEARGPRVFWSGKSQDSRLRLSRSSGTPPASIILPGQVGGRCVCQSAVARQAGGALSAG
jgi:hypothetical protein